MKVLSHDHRHQGARKRAWEAALRKGMRESYSRGQVILQAPVRSVHLLQRGLVLQEVFLPNGKRRILAMLSAGWTLGEDHLLAAGWPDMVYTALTDCKSISWPDHVARRVLLKEPLIAHDLLEHLAAKLALQTHQLAATSGLDARARVYQLLVELIRSSLALAHLPEREELASNSPETPAIPLAFKLTQAALADAAATSRVTISRTLKPLRHQKLIKTGRSSLTILRPYQVLNYALDKLKKRLGPSYADHLEPIVVHPSAARQRV